MVDYGRVKYSEVYSDVRDMESEVEWSRAIVE